MIDPRKIGSYDILDESSEDGLLSVYRAHDRLTGKPVTIKIFRGGDSALKTRFVELTELNAQLVHPNIVSVVDAGLHEGSPYVVEEHLEGQRLSEVIAAREQLPADVKLDYLLGIATGLAHAHSRQVLHRDLRPTNVFIVSGSAKVVDFGISRLLADARTKLAQDEPILIDSASYLAPEQVLGREPDTAMELFAFGVTAYELLTYQRPYRAESLTDLLHQLLEAEAPSVRALWSDCPADLANLVDECMRKEPEKRPQSLSEVADRIGSIRRTPPAETLPSLPLADAADQGLAQPTVAEPPAASVAEAAHPPASSKPSARPPSRGILRAAVAGGVAALILVLLALAGRRLVSRSPTDVEGRPAAAASEPAVAMSAPPAPGGRLLIDALPWGEVSTVTDGLGNRVALPDKAYTPLLLPVATGDYVVSITHPEASESRTCEVRIEGGEIGTCRVEFARLGTVEYFKETGWWR